MNRRAIITLGLALLLAGAAGNAVSAGASKIGFLSPLAESSPIREGFRQGLRDLGYIEGRNIVIEWRQTTGVGNELQAHVDELINARVDIIVATGTPAAAVAMRATGTIPIVFASVGDPVAAGFAASLARPGRNGTGVSVVSTELYPKRVEFLHQLAPKAKRITYLTNSSNPIAPALLEEVEKAARKLGVQIQVRDARNGGELDAVLQSLSKTRPEAILLGGDLLYLANMKNVAAAVRKARVPAMFPYDEYHEVGALMSFSASMREAGHLAAGYVDKILKGAKPSELPIQQISKFELTIDLSLAREQGIKVPQEMLFRADRVIQ